MGSPDLVDNAWYNDDPYNIYDDDGNGYWNDLHGWNFGDDDSMTKPFCPSGPVWYEDPNNPFYSTFPGLGHGTHVAGIAAAVGNNEIGVAGVNWNAAIMPVRIWGCCNPTDPNCPGPFLATAVAAIDYAVNEGADIINASWGIGGGCAARPTMCAQTLYDAINRAQDREVLFVSASGNHGQDIDSNSPGDLYNYSYPANYDLDGIISVHSTDADDDGFGNYGTVSVDIGAPGINILSTMYDILEGDIYDYRSGTSMAAPHVAGVASLVRTLSPKIPAKLSKLLIMDNADTVGSLSGMSVTGGRLNAFNVLDSYDPNAPAQITNLAASTTTSYSMGLTWTSKGDDGTTGTAALYQVRRSASSIDESNFYLAIPSGNEPAPQSSGTNQSMTVSGLSVGTCYYFRMKGFDEWGNGPLSNEVKCGTRPQACVTSYCKVGGEAFLRCTFSDSYGSCGCCQYTCVADETCEAADPTPIYACGNYCQ